MLPDPGWRGCALIPVEVAFEEDGEAQLALGDGRCRAIARNVHLFPDSVRQIPRRADGIQAVLNFDFGQGPAMVTRNYAQLDIELPFYQSHGVASDGFLKLAGEAADGRPIDPRRAGGREPPVSR